MCHFRVDCIERGIRLEGLRQSWRPWLAEAKWPVRGVEGRSATEGRD
jgi:hypothetical protein